MFTLAHISDVHLAPLPRPWPHQLLGQRVFGYVNWHVLGRKRHHDRSTLDTLIGHLNAQSHDHIAFTGDIVNIALPQEFDAARSWLEALGPPDRISFVPGNHDAYVALPAAKGLGAIAPYMESDAEGAKYVKSTRAAPYNGFPYVRILGNIALVGLASGIPTPPMFATGRLGDAQRAALEGALTSLKAHGHCIVVMIHHPPLPGLAVPFRDLTDADELATIFSRHQVQLVLHGHNHRNELAWGEGPQARFPVVGVPSASMADASHRPLARYNLYDIRQVDETWNIVMRGFAARSAGGPVEQIEERALVPTPDRELTP